MDMDIENDIENNPEPTEIYPDGFGLSLEEVQNIINQKCGISVPNDDPIMLIVIILNAFLYEQQKLQNSHKEVMEEAFQNIFNNFFEEFDKYFQGQGFEPKKEKEEENKKIEKNKYIDLGIIIGITILIFILLKHFNLF